jgi:nitrite reductase/ring-hydroxylating ferredoxin subunit
MPKIKIARLEELRKKRSVKFKFRRDGISRDGFAAWFDGQVIVYENVCRHLPLTIDYGDNQFFTDDGKTIICKTHGAVYEPLTGLCVEGPCKGASLFPVPFEIREETIWVETED